MRRYVPETLTTTEALVEGAIARDPYRSLPDHALEARLRDEEAKRDLLLGTSQAHLVERIDENIAAIRKEQRRRRVVT